MTGLREKIHAAISQDHLEDSEFWALASALCEHQKTQNLPYRRFCERFPNLPIPALVTDAFKVHSLPLRSFSGPPKAVFHSSGTTTELSSHHAFSSLKLYEHSILQAWKRLGPSPADRCFFLCRSPSLSPHSSLLHMFSTLARAWKSSESFFIQSNDGSWDLSPLRTASSPVSLLGTALNFLDLFNSLEEPLELPSGSWAMETGGYKRTGLEISKHELYEKFESHLGLAPTSVWNEYSMTELSSQFYCSAISNPHQGPHWTRTRIVDPETLEEVNIGDPGYLVIYDLANVDSVLAIQTQDFAIREHDGFTLLGRDTGALPRGCSRALL